MHRKAIEVQSAIQHLQDSIETLAATAVVFKRTVELRILLEITFQYFLVNLNYILTKDASSASEKHTSPYGSFNSKPVALQDAFEGASSPNEANWPETLTGLADALTQLLEVRSM